MGMTQEERWLSRYNEVVDFINANHRNPSKHRIEEHDMLNWLRASAWSCIGCREAGISNQWGRTESQLKGWLFLFLGVRACGVAE